MRFLIPTIAIGLVVAWRLGRYKPRYCQCQPSMRPFPRHDWLGDYTMCMDCGRELAPA